MIDESDQQYVESLHQQLEISKLNDIRREREYGQLSMFGQADTNIVQWQLELKEDLERMEHLLKGDYISFDDKGNEHWKEQTDDRYKPFDNHGVQLLMNVICSYLNRNTLLSNYNNDTINNKMMDLGNDLNDMILMKYEEMGMNTEEKRKLYPMIVREIVDTIHSAYLRALGGEERTSLRRMMHVSQNINPGGDFNNPYGKKPVKLLSPSTWFGGAR